MKNSGNLPKHPYTRAAFWVNPINWFWLNSKPPITEKGQEMYYDFVQAMQKENDIKKKAI